MENYLKNLENINSWNNLVKHLTLKFNLDNKMAIDSDEALAAIRVAHSLQSNSIEPVIKTNLAFYQNNYTSGLNDLNFILSEIAHEYKEGDEVNLPNSDKLAIADCIQRIEDGILNMAGYTVYQIHEAGNKTSIPPSLTDFADKALNHYLSTIERKATYDKIYNEADERKIDIEQVQREHEAREKEIMASSVEGKEPKKIISVDIDDIDEM